MVSETGPKRQMQRSKLSSQLYSMVKNDILQGQLLPGSPISEEALAETYGVSRSPAREALAELERAGLTQRSGMRDRKITVPSLEMIREKFELWWIVDVGRTYLASLSASEDDVDELERYAEQMATAVEQNDVRTYKSVSHKFHLKIRHSCRNEAVNEVGRDCDVYLDWFENLYDRYPECSMVIVQEHRSILDAFKRRDLAGLSETIRNHIERQRDRILEHFQAAQVKPKARSKLSARQPVS